MKTQGQWPKATAARRKKENGTGLRSRHSRERGAAMAEFALIAPFLIILIFGIIQFSIAFNRSQAVEAAAREGARLGSLSTTTPSEINNRVLDTLTGIPFDSPPVVSPGASCQGRQGGERKVVVSLEHEVEIPLLFTRTITLSGEAVFRCEA